MIINPIQRVRPKLTPITPMELFIQQVNGNMEAIRYDRRGMDYIPAQMGGIFGQYSVFDEEVIIQLTDFEVL